jgi:hypothetical protein
MYLLTESYAHEDKKLMFPYIPKKKMKARNFIPKKFNERRYE